MQTNKVLLIGVIAICIVIGIAGATEDAVQNVTVSVNPITATITAPVDFWVGPIERGVVNEIFIGNVSISSNAPPEYLMNLTVSADYTNWEFVTPMQVNSFSGWSNLVNGTLLESTASTIIPVDIPVTIRQFVGGEPSGDYTVVLEYSLSIISPTA